MSISTRLLAAATAASLVLAGLAGPAAAQEKVRLLLDWFVNPDHAALVVARERGQRRQRQRGAHGLDGGDETDQHEEGRGIGAEGTGRGIHALGPVHDGCAPARPDSTVKLASVRQPAATALRTPVGESSTA